MQFPVKDFRTRRRFLLGASVGTLRASCRKTVIAVPNIDSVTSYNERNDMTGDWSPMRKVLWVYVYYTYLSWIYWLQSCYVEMAFIQLTHHVTHWSRSIWLSDLQVIYRDVCTSGRQLTLIYVKDTFANKHNLVRESGRVVINEPRLKVIRLHSIYYEALWNMADRCKWVSVFIALINTGS